MVFITSMLLTAYSTHSQQKSDVILTNKIDFSLKDKSKESSIFKYESSERDKRQILSPIQIQDVLRMTVPLSEKEKEEMTMTTEDVDRVDPSIQLLWETLVNSDSEITGLEVKEPPEVVSR